jgi:predicted cobalt transporter CbtA
VSLGRALRRGAVAGAAGGGALALALAVLGGPLLAEAVALEEPGGGGPFGRGVQQVAGVVGAVALGVALGVVFAVVFTAARHRLPGGDDWRRSLWLAAAAFVAVHLVPALKYPPNPPGVGDPATVGRRTALYVLLIAFSVVATVGAVRLGGWLAARGMAPAPRHVVTAVAWSALVAAALAGFPTPPDAVEAPATLVWQFRLTVVGGWLGLWAVTGAVFGWLALPPADRRVGPAPPGEASEELRRSGRG